MSVAPVTVLPPVKLPGLEKMKLANRDVATEVAVIAVPVREVRAMRMSAKMDLEMLAPAKHQFVKLQLVIRVTASGANVEVAATNAEADETGVQIVVANGRENAATQIVATQIVATQNVATLALLSRDAMKHRSMTNRLSKSMATRWMI